MRQSKLQFYYSIAEYDTIDIYEFNVAEYSALSSTRNQKKIYKKEKYNKQAPVPL